jgi:type VI secretion-associated protein, ImpA family
MIEIDGFLEPVAGADPCGENLYYSPVFDKIREARRQDDAGPMGQWERELKASDFRTVIKLAEETLRTKTKDLWLAAWLTEAWINRDRIPGLLAGLKLITALMTTFWEGLHPDVEDADLGLRATPLEWLGSAATAPSPILLLKAIPLTESGVTWLVYKDARAMGYEDAVRGNDARTKARAAAIKEGKLSPEEFDKQFAATPKAFYRQLESDCGDAAAVLADLNRFCDERFGDDSPNFSPLRSALEDIATDVHSLLHKKLETDPDPVEAPPASPDSQPAGGADDPVSISLTQAAALSPLPDFANFSAGPIATGAEAAMYVLAAAQFLRRETPSSPVSYLIVRALRWGELRATNDQLDALLEAPAGDVRRTIRQYANQKDWKRLLETVETVMASACGRGWLDLQRYSILACEGLGYQAASKAIRSELKTLLVDFPQLPTAILNDDTGAANPETLNWLRQEGFVL